MRSVTLLCGAAVLALSLAGHAHPDHGGKDHPHDHGDEPHEESDAVKKKRLERVIRQAERRQRNNKQRTADRRKHLKQRLGRHLNGGAVTPAITEELKVHAQRTAALRQIRYMAAKADDFETVIAADKVLARQNRNHDTWWRTALRAARKKQ